MATTKIQRLKNRYRAMCSRRDAFKNVFTPIYKYVLLRPSFYGDANAPTRSAKLSVKDVSDDEVVDQARTSAAALGGALWPNTAESFELVPKPPAFAAYDETFLFESREVKDYFTKATQIIRDIIDAPESGFHAAWAEYLDEQIVIGTSGIYGEETGDVRVPIRFRSISIETCVIDEGADGAVDTVYFELYYTIRQMKERYGESCSSKVKELYKAEKFDDYVKVIHAVEPRQGGKAGEQADKKPYASTHFEFDTDHELRDGGMDEKCAFVTRFRKRPTEVFGRSLASDAIASIKELNILRAAYSKALMRIVAPPTGIYHDQVGGAGELDLSPDAKNTLYATGAIPQGRPPVEQLINISEPQTAEVRIEKLTAKIATKFLVDRLLDFNNKSRMTLGEAQLRNDYRNQALGPIFSRQIVELLQPLIKFAVSVAWRNGLLGLNPLDPADRLMIQYLRQAGREPLVVPEVIAKHMDRHSAPFGVRFISPAARAMQADSIVGMEKLLNVVLTFANGGRPDAMHVVKVDEFVQLYGDRVGAPAEIIRGTDEIRKERSAQNAAQDRAMQLAEAEQIATIKDKEAKAIKNLSVAQQKPQVYGGALGA